VRALTDAAGSVVQTYRTDAFGVPVAGGAQGGVSQRLQYVGEERDGDDPGSCAPAPTTPARAASSPETACGKGRDSSLAWPARAEVQDENDDRDCRRNECQKSSDRLTNGTDGRHPNQRAGGYCQDHEDSHDYERFKRPSKAPEHSPTSAHVLTAEWKKRDVLMPWFQEWPLPADRVRRRLVTLAGRTSAPPA
jgi:hypothetical protein